MKMQSSEGYYLSSSQAVIMTPTIKLSSMDLSVKNGKFTSGSGSLFVVGKLEEFLLSIAIYKA